MYISHFRVCVLNKKEGNLVICNNMDEMDGTMLTEISQTEKRQIMHGIIYTKTFF